MINIKKILQKQCCMSIDKFKTKVWNTTPWFERSILMSEGFAFCAISDLFNIEVILESGVYNGRSTQMWANYFSSDTLIIAVEKAQLLKSTFKRLEPYKNVKIFRGDGPIIISDFISKFPNKKIGIFLDGPKDTAALNFAKKAFLQLNVFVVAIHDMSVTKGRFNIDCPELNGKKGELYYSLGRIEFDKWELGQFLTDEEWFVNEYSWLDKDESNFDAKQRFHWTPYTIIGTGKPNRELGSYGPTVGFAFRKKDINVT